MPGEDILITDDSPDVLETMGEILEFAGYTVRRAENGRVALEMMTERRPALLLLDLMMPVMSGWELLEELRRDPALQSVPVLVISAATSPPSGVPMLKKPISVDQLLEAVCNSVAPSQP